MVIDMIFDRTQQLPDHSKELIKKNIEIVKYPKGHILLKEGKIEHDLYFIRKGIVRAYSNHDGNDVTFWFGQEGDLALSIKGYVNNEKGYESIELLEDCEFYKLKNSTLQILFSEDIHIANWGRKQVENLFLETEQRLISRLFRNASERYMDLLKNEPKLLQRVKLSHLASYLGITQVSLSRIRGKVS